MRPIFRTVDPDEPEREITQRDQFNTDEVTLAETLVRESLQNSNDARVSSDRAVRVRLSIREPDTANAPFWGSLLAPLEPHLTACGIDLRGIDLSMPRILSVEDFGTTGLTGSPDAKDNSNFQDFWRRVGRSHKAGDKAGSWGLGKIVFPASSRVRSFFGLTIRHDDPDRRALLMGQSLLRYHDIGLERFDPLGLFAVEAPLNGKPFRGPATEPAFTRRFAEAAGFSRKNEPGLSIAIPFISDELTAPELIPYVVRNYFFPILTGALEVEIGGESIDAESFEALAAKHGGPALADGHLIRFIREVNAARANRPTLALPLEWSSHEPEAGIDADELKSLRDAYAARKLIHVRATASIAPKTGRTDTGTYDLFIQRAEENVQTTPLFVRGSITVPGEAQSFPSRTTFAALIASDGVVSRFLRDAENPAHTRWNGQAEKLSDNWKNASTRLTQIRKSLRAVHDMLAQAVERVEEDTLRSIISVPDTGTKERSPRKPPVIRKPTVPKVAPSPKLFNVSKSPSGFVVRPGSAISEHGLPFQIRVKTGYDLARGDPFKKHSPFDFDLTKPGDVTIEASGATCNAVAPNEIVVEVAQPDFEVRVEGFDTHRDLQIKATR